MRTIDMQTWSRREHFEFLNTFSYPHFNLCANVDPTRFYPAVKQRNISFTVAVVYVIARAANAIPEFRLRIRGEKVVEHEIIHPAVTILRDDELYTFCELDYVEDFPAFAANAAERIAYVKDNPTLENPPGKDDLLYMSAIPWVSFTSFMHPLQWSPVDSIPRFGWGKRFQEGEQIKMPLSVQGHHALMDAIHMGKLYAQVQALLDQPDAYLGAA